MREKNEDVLLETVGKLVIGLLFLLVLPILGLAWMIKFLHHRYAASSHSLYIAAGVGILFIFLTLDYVSFTLFALPNEMLHRLDETIPVSEKTPGLIFIGFLQVFSLSVVLAGVWEWWDTICGRNVVRDHYRNKDRKPKNLSLGIYQRKLNKAVERYQKGVLLGLDDRAKIVSLDDETLNEHTFLVGTTGSGKTNTILTFIEGAFVSGKPIIFIDGKGDRDLILYLEEKAKTFGRPFQVFTFDSLSMVHYNPFASGTPTELKDKFMTLFGWSEVYYQDIASKTLQLVFKILQQAGLETSLEHVAHYLHKDRLKQLLMEMDHVPEPVPAGVQEEEDDFFSAIEKEPKPSRASAFSRWYQQIDDLDMRDLAGLRNKLDDLLDSDVGEKLNSKGPCIDLNEVISTGGVLLFSLDSLKYPSFSRSFGKLVINDIRTAISEKNVRGNGGRVSLIFDEFNVFASRQVVDVINKSRSSGFEALIATQSLADLDAVDKALRRQILQNCNAKIIMRQNDAVDAEDLANTIGTVETPDFTHQLGEDGFTGMGTLKETRKFVIHPDGIKSLGRGQAVVLQKLPNGGSETRFVQVRRMK